MSFLHRKLRGGFPLQSYEDSGGISNFFSYFATCREVLSSNQMKAPRNGAAIRHKVTHCKTCKYSSIMKKISALILAAVLACSAATAQNRSSVADSISGVTTTATSDSVSTSADVDDYLAEGQTAQAPVISVEDGKWVVEYDGEDYVISDLVEDAGFARKFRDLENLDEETLLLKDNMGAATAIIAIIFAVPCLTIIVGLIVILTFALRRNRGRNELINNAIEHDYQLPDSFYLGQKSINGAPGTPLRDSKKFYSATTLIAIGLSLVIFAFYADANFFILAGGIPFLIGVGQLIGYYCVPTAPRQGGYPPYGYGSNWQMPDSNIGNRPSCSQYPQQSQQPAGYPPQQGQCPGQTTSAPTYGCETPVTPQTPPPYTPSDR